MPEGLKTFELIDRLNLLLTNAKMIPLSNRVMMDKAELSALLRQLEDSIAPEMKKARQVLDMEEKIITESKRQADELSRSAAAAAAKVQEDAAAKANGQIADAQQRASAMLRDSSDRANATVADAQQRASAMVADAQAHAQMLVSENEITLRSQAEAQELMNRTQQECRAYSDQVHLSVSKMLEEADDGLAQQLDAVRALRQQLNVSP